MTFIQDLQERGLIHSNSGLESLEAEMANGQIRGYIGFDPTAPSLHVGHLQQVVLLYLLSQAGHAPIALLGTSTGMIGDPSGKSDERQMMDGNTVGMNASSIMNQISHLMGNRVIFVNNAYLGSVRLLEFLRDVGKHFSVNAMISRDSVKSRLEQREHGISYTEFSYMLLQAYDFMRLYDDFGCCLQMGGSDQWGNIASGIDLVRRNRGVEVHGITSPLLTREDGKKFGKSEDGNIWLDPKLTPPFDFYQYWYNTSDADVERYLKCLTLKSLQAINGVLEQHRKNPVYRVAQTALADALTAWVHGEDVLERVRNAQSVLFGNNVDLRQCSPDVLKDVFKDFPGMDITQADLGHLLLPTALVKTGLFSSLGNARKAMAQRAVSLNFEVEVGPQRFITREDVLPGGVVLLRRGQKNWRCLRVLPVDV